MNLLRNKPIASHLTIRTVECQSLWNILGTAFVSIFKHAMCKGGTQLGNSLFNVANKAYTIPDDNIDTYFDGLGGKHNQNHQIIEGMHLLCSWMAHICLKKASL